LKDEAELLAAQVGQLVALEAGDFHAIEHVRAAGGPIQAPQHVHEGRLA